MRQLLQKVRSSSTNRLLRIVALSTAGSSILYSNRDTDSVKTTLSVSVPAPLRDSFLLQWPIVKELIRSPSTLTSNLSPYGNAQLFLSRIGSVPSEDVNKDASGKLGDGSRSIATAVAMVIPALVNITVPCSRNMENIGSGTIIDPDGTILTFAHVVVDFQGETVTLKGEVDVTLQDGQTFVGTVVNADLHSDIAIVKINSILPLPSAKLGSSSKLCPGEWVVALGCPLSLQNSITAGVVSNVMGLGGMPREYVQTDCAINHGHSGGPLVDVDGEIIGVNVLKLATAGLSFAVPSDSVFKVLEHFKKNGRDFRPWLGMKMLDLNNTIVSQLKDGDPMFPNVNKGVLVYMVTPRSPADIADFFRVMLSLNSMGSQLGASIIELMEGQVGMPLNVVVKRENDTSFLLTVVPEDANPEF